MSHDEIGNVLVAQGKLTEALKSYHDSLVIRERLAEAAPGNAGWQSDLSVSYDRVGDALMAQWRLSEALKSYRNSLTVQERLAKANPANARWQVDLALCHGKLGRFYVKKGDTAEAAREFKAGRAIIAPLAERSRNGRWQGYLRSFDAEIAKLQGRR